MNRFALLCVLAAALVVCGCVQSGAGAASATAQQKPVPQVCFANGKCLAVEIASTERERETGLMDRPSLAQNSGMLFVFDSPGNYNFWMKNTLIPLDIAWIDAGGKVVDVQQMQPCRQDPCQIYVPNATAQFALEAGQGALGQNGVSVGQKVTFANVT